MAKRVLILVLLIVIAAFAARALIYPAVMQNTSVSPTINKGETMLISRLERFTNQPFRRFEVIAIMPPFLKGQTYDPVETPLSVFADLTGIPVAPMPAIELQRVIALPNETVVIRKGLGIFVDGKMLDERSYTKDLPHTDVFVLADIIRESMENGVMHSYENSEAPIVVPPDTVFVMPDDRINFTGSEEWGFLPQKRVVGKVAYKIADKGFEELKTPAVKFATEKIAINDDGVRALEKGEYTKAIHLFKSALAIDNNFELARDNLSIAYNNFAIQSAGKPAIALDSLHKALFLDPDNELTKKNLAGILKRMGKDASKFEDRVALAEDALKHKKAISALVEYRAAVKLQPTPKVLAKVSALESQCNFPPHAIPEDLVTATVATAEKSTPDSQPKLRSDQDSEAIPSAETSKDAATAKVVKSQNEVSTPERKKKIATKESAPVAAPEDGVPIKHATEKSNTSFDLGAFVQNFVASFSKEGASETEVSPEGYRGPPRLKKENH